MCPCISSKSKYAICLRNASGLMVPSVSERVNYCFGVYELCPFFGSKERNDATIINGLYEGAM